MLILVSSLPEMFDPYASLRADSYRPAPRGYYVVKSLLVWGGVFGILVGLYRNDVLREVSRKIGQEKRYLAAESLLVGSPGWGTPRSMEPVLTGQNAPVAIPAPVPEAAAVAPAPVAEAPKPASAPAAPAAAPAPMAAAAPADPLKPVSLDSLPPDPLKPVSLDSLPLAGASTAKSISLDEAAPRAAAPAAATPGSASMRLVSS